MPRILAICAAPPGPNPGMATVDLALYFLLQRHRLGDVTFACLYDPAEIHARRAGSDSKELAQRHDLPFIYRTLPRGTTIFEESDAILYWGDFLHARDYSEEVAEILVQLGVEPSMEKAQGRVRQQLFLVGASDTLLSKTLCFGGTSIFNRARDYTDPIYFAEAGNIMGRARRVWMRDVFSANQVSRFRPPSIPTLGVDCALLLRTEDTDGLPLSSTWTQSPPNAGTVGVYFGRSHATTLLSRFAKALCAATNRQAEWLPWGGSGAFPEESRRAYRSFWQLKSPEAALGKPKLGDLLRRLSCYSFVITDTYHVAVNSWRLGVPALCIARAFPSEAHFNVSSGWRHGWRDKRQAFFAMSDAMEYCFFAEELEDRKRFRYRVAHATQVMQERELAASVTERIRQQRDYCESELVSEIRDVLEGAVPRHSGGSARLHSAN